MAAFQYNVNIDAGSKEEAEKKLNAAISLMKSACSQMSVDDFVRFASKIKEHPGLINTAKKFVL